MQITTSLARAFAVNVVAARVTASSALAVGNLAAASVPCGLRKGGAHHNEPAL